MAPTELRHWVGALQPNLQPRKSAVFFYKKLWSKVEPQIASEVSTNGGVLGWRYVIILIGIGILRELDAYIGDAPHIGW